MRGSGLRGLGSTPSSPTLRQAQGLTTLSKKGPEFIEGLRFMFQVYILRSNKNHLYVGVSADVEARIDRHMKGDGAEFTKRTKSYNLVYIESFATLREARQRERQIKGWRREKKENLIRFGKPEI